MSEPWADAADNSKRSYDVGVEALRERLEKSKVEIGPHTLYCEDARFIAPTLVEVDAVISDPPYGISAVLGMGGGGKGDGGMWRGVRIAGDEDTLIRDQVLQCLNRPFAIFMKAMTPPPPGARACVVWDKGEHTGAGDLSLPWKPSFELVGIGGPGWTGPYRQGGIVRANAVAGCVGNRNDGHRYHPFEKPLEIMAHFVERRARAEIICDPFMGSGTTGVACARLGRRFIGIEIERRYFDIACRRIEEATKQADLFIEQPKREKPVQEVLL